MIYFIYKERERERIYMYIYILYITSMPACDVVADQHTKKLKITILFWITHGELIKE